MAITQAPINTSSCCSVDSLPTHRLAAESPEEGGAAGGQNGVGNSVSSSDVADDHTDARQHTLPPPPPTHEIQSTF